MYLNVTNSFVSRERGFLLPVALFILVAMSVLALAIARTSSQTHVAATQELVSVQTFYAAESGLQAGFSRLLFPEADDRAVTDANCSTINSSGLSFDATGLASCTVALSCICTDENGAACGTDPDAQISYYRLLSEASCGSGSLSAQRTLEAGTLSPFID
ncbi:pilus assembly PilX family protein [Marinimicrobium alkaliphilum]|uniref:pilus assembly PilX family protein n=1 Tax=Marinimicrobium alkaliphilum TaxID=2202654 RepID=UPI000DB96BD4|nr:pilus assembly PilX N-terminal domain-containing protein [Marinimicrobium alkaliphilum]